MSNGPHPHNDPLRRYKVCTFCAGSGKIAHTKCPMCNQGYIAYSLDTRYNGETKTS